MAQVLLREYGCMRGNSSSLLFYPKIARGGGQKCPYMLPNVQLMQDDSSRSDESSSAHLYPVGCGFTPKAPIFDTIEA